MTDILNKRVREFYARTYDAAVADWPGEIDFYRGYARKARDAGQAVLEVACGTGRVLQRLAEEGVAATGLDNSEPMLVVARRKSAGLSNVNWVLADMRDFDLEQRYGLILIPGHAFQNLVTAEDQVACLRAIKRHLAPGGLLIVHLDHQDVGWLGRIEKEERGVFQEAGSFKHPESGRLVRARQAWTYEPGSQTAVAQTIWEELDDEGQVSGTWDTGPIRLHCVFRFEMEHLLARTGYEIKAVYGSFTVEELGDESEEMIWVGRV